MNIRILAHHQITTQIITGCLLAWAVIFAAPGGAQAEVASVYEARYSEAILAFNAKNYGQSIEILNELIRKEPLTAEFLELKALALKTKKNNKESAKTFRQLIRAKRKAKAPLKEIAPYYYELAVINFRERKFKAARVYFRRSIKGDVNLGPSQFFLGIIAFQNNDLKKAETYFIAVTDDNLPQLKPGAHYYLAQIYSRNGQSREATLAFKKAGDEAQDLIDDEKIGAEAKKVAKQILKASKHAINPMDRGRFFGNFALSTGYDSNVLTIPNSSVNTQSTGKASLQAVAQTGFGFLSSPAKTIQYVPSISVSYNYNFNSSSGSAEYLNSVIALYLTYKPLNRTNFGIKTDLTFVMNNSDGGLSPFMTTPSVGPYFRHSFANKAQIGGTATIASQTFEQESDTSDSDSDTRSGTLIKTKVYFQHQRGGRWWNPYISANFNIDGAEGSNFENESIGFNFANTFHFIKGVNLNFNFGLAFTGFNQRSSGDRDDTLMSFSLAGTKQWTKKLAIIGVASYYTNSSSDDSTYSYKRFVVSGGLSYAIF